MSDRPLIALYKAFSGGEWFLASLEAVAPVVDGYAVVFSEGPWVPSLPLRGDCDAPLAAFRAEHPSATIAAVRERFTRQAEQYAAGLALVRRTWGDGARVLVVDTDEIWPLEDLRTLRATMDARPGHEHYRSGIVTYLKSPLYRVWPPEIARVVVGLGSCGAREIRGRFQATQRGERSLDVPQIAVHHFPYVRADESTLRHKLLSTGSQEHAPSDYNWYDSVYRLLPFGTDLHMTVGYESVWKCIKILHPYDVPREAWRAEFLRERHLAVCRQWRECVRELPADESVMPTPTAPDGDLYRADFAPFTTSYDELISRLKSTVLEALWLLHSARDTEPTGTILEIGSGSGGSMAVMATGAPTARLISVDPFEPYDETTHAGIMRNVREGNEAEFWSAARQFHFAERVRHIKRRSAEAAAEVMDGSCSLVFVDGNHSRPVVADDLERYWPKVEPGGLLVGHDYSARFPGVVQAADEWDGEIVVPPGTSLFYRRKETA